MLLFVKLLIKLIMAAILLADVCALIVISAPGASGPMQRAAHIAWLWSRKSAQCKLGDVIRYERIGMDPVAPELRAAIHVIGQEGDQDLNATPLGNFWIHHKDARELAVMLSEQSRGVYEAAGHGVHSGDVVLDCGANIGVYTKHALALGARLVVAIEPAPETLPILRRNLAAEIEAGKVIVVPKGVWNQDGELTFYLDKESWSDSFVGTGRENAKQVKAPLVTIDHMVRDLKLERVDLIKMDIEGAERQALNGAVDTVNRFHPRLAIALEHLEHDAEELPQLIRRLWPQMHTVCGPCVMENPGGIVRIQPQVVAAY